MAGIIKLTIHKIKVDDKIPITLLENFINTKRATEPLTPISAIVMVGANVIKKKTSITERIDSKKLISTSKTCNKIKN
jgi:hypothetical protein